MKKYTVKDLLKLSSELTIDNLLTNRVHLNGIGWETVEITDKEEYLSQAVDVIGGRTETKNRIKNILNNPINVNHWAIKRMQIREYNNRIFVSYCAGQDYPREIKSLRDYLRKL